jgi:lipoprotein-releasing system permease protein
VETAISRIKIWFDVFTSNFITLQFNFSVLNLSYFISKRIRRPDTGSFSSIIHKVAIASIAIGLAAAIVSFLIMHGFQSAVKNKIYAFSNHLLITKFTMNNAVAEQPFDFQIELYKNKEKFPFVKHVQEYSHKAGLIKTNSEVLGIVFKGVGKSFNKAVFDESLVEGRFIHFTDSVYAKEVVISKVIANKINAKLNDEIIIHFFQNPPRFRRLKIVGIYETNLSEYFDGKIIIGDNRLVQVLNNWKENEAGGLEVNIDFNSFDQWQLRKNDWARFLSELDEHIISNPDEQNKFLSAASAIWEYKFDFDKVALAEAQTQIGDDMDYDLNIETVRDKFYQVFDWLDLVKRQVRILLVIILIVVSVNMISVVLILVMERIPMVGLLKALGARDRLVRSVFFYNGLNLIFKGMLIGNLAGLGFCFLQSQFHIIKLNAHDYYMSYVPIEWHLDTVIWLNLIVLVVVSVVLILPTRFIVRILPVNAIRFD